MNKKIIISIIIIVFLGGAVGLMSQTSKDPYKDTQPAVRGVASTTQYSLADVTKHASVTSCWSAIGGNVYDLTSWIAEHPGGEPAILGICGVDGTEAFRGQHGGQRRPESELTKYIIGSLIQ